jgi:DNA-binding transcriptional ArsR family regulator
LVDDYVGRVKQRHTSPGDLDIAAVGALVADPARCWILLALADGRPRPAGWLAAAAGVSAATASSHLAKLTGAGLLQVEASGRNRHYRLSGPEVAELIEALERFASVAPVHSLRQSRRAQALRTARRCYDHLAGHVAVELNRVLVERDLLHRDDGDEAYELTTAGRAFLDGLGVALPPRRRLVRHHIDTTEQRPHLSGALGRGLMERMIELGWIRPSTDSRAIHVTPAGQAGLVETFGIAPVG